MTSGPAGNKVSSIYNFIHSKGLFPQDSKIAGRVNTQIQLKKSSLRMRPPFWAFCKKIYSDGHGLGPLPIPE